ncbi:Nramp family divalent metal transporter [Altererythrobacter arenosus]|uniref:Nramp family divalent metal transporter n=1 Tax=Altererythrobacter arenosus TaxID=3032592 RepID=A0ABY8FWK2_9SPHN|nr:Nramp family divalent metal transporter [Altererythrobacter sp. CAU 1644]WFL76414.1 Nramp family divalent metal transporter [Altererythrobacter sp. CAU 1644]
MLSRIRNIGPGALVTAAFIGPGTVTTSTLAGASFGYTLLWAVLFATVATMVLQEMSARLGVVTQKGLGETLVEVLRTSFWRWPMIVLIGLALYLGNSAYEAGNLSGAALGLAALTGDSEGSFVLSVGAIAALAAGLLWVGSYRHIERVLVGLVVVMALAFVATFAIVRPDLGALGRGLLVPAIPEGGLLTVVALIGTTVVPYNLFLHAAAAKRRWPSPESLSDARADTAIAIGLGGLITILIVSTAAASMFAAGLSVESAGDMATQLEPLFGSYSKYLLGAGLFAAGLSSAITAPLATAYAMTEILPIATGSKRAMHRAVALSVVAIGAALALAGIKPITIILTAQFANGLLLPIIAVFLLFAMNQKAVLGRYANGVLTNTAGAAVVLVAAILGLRLVLRAAESTEWLGITSPL